jgi:hypothetical protein
MWKQWTMVGNEVLTITKIWNCENGNTKNHVVMAGIRLLPKALTWHKALSGFKCKAPHIEFWPSSHNH